MTYKSNIKMHLHNGTQTEQKWTSRWEAAGNRLQMSSLLQGNEVSLLLCPGVKSILYTVSTVFWPIVHVQYCYSQWLKLLTYQQKCYNNENITVKHNMMHEIIVLSRKLVSVEAKTVEKMPDWQRQNINNLCIRCSGTRISWWELGYWNKKT